MNQKTQKKSQNNFLINTLFYSSIVVISVGLTTFGIYGYRNFLEKKQDQQAFDSFNEQIKKIKEIDNIVDDIVDDIVNDIV